MSYDQYLFSQLIGVYYPHFKSIAYDYQYEDAILYYNEFEKSSFNNENVDIYTCIVNYLENNKLPIDII